MNPRVSLARVIRDAGSLCYLGVLALILFAAPRVVYACRVAFVADNAPLFLAAAIILAVALSLAFTVLARVLKRSRLEDTRAFALMVALWCLALLGAQALIARATWFEGGWDVGLLARLYPQPAASFTEYLSHYPNNLLLYDVFRHLDGIAAMMGMDNPYPLYIAGSCASVTLAIALTSISAHKSLGAPTGLGTLVIGTLFLGLSPWVLVPYSDAYAMPWPALMLAAYTLIRHPLPRWGIIGFSAMVGYSVKPTAIFMAVALVVVGTGGLMTRFQTRSEQPEQPEQPERTTRRLPGVAIAAAAASLALGAALGWTSVQAVEQIGPRFDPAQAVPSTHFFAMGANEESMGVFNAEDERTTLSIEPSERAAAMREVWLERLRDMGPIGIIKLAARKILTVYADGTLAWNQEGAFFYVLHAQGTLFTDFYGIGNPAPPAHAYRAIAQVIWLCLVIGIVAIAPARRKERAPAIETASFITLALITCFLVVSEARARYLILYAPVFVAMGCWGLSQAGIALSRLVGRSSTSKE